MLVLLGTSHLVSAQTVGQYYFKARNSAVLENMSGATQIFAQETIFVSPLQSLFQFSLCWQVLYRFCVSEDCVVICERWQSNSVYTPYPYDNYFSQDACNT
jgi:hypothetical protein